MPRARSTLAGLACLMLTACGEPQSTSTQDQAAADAKARELGRDTDKTVFDDMIQTQDKARAVEGVVLDRKNNLDAAMENTERTAPSDQ